MIPNCPQCKKPMVARRSARGPFYGCSDFPNCRGSRSMTVEAPEPVRTGRVSALDDDSLPAEIRNPAPASNWKRKQEAVYEPILKVPGSPEQEVIWHALLTGKTHVIVKACAGCLAGSTLVDCPRNLDKFPAGIPIQDLVGQTPLVYGYSTRLKRIVLRQATRVWKTAKKMPVFKVTFRKETSTGKYFEQAPNYVIGTANHPFLTRAIPNPTFSGWNMEPPIFGGYKNLIDLKPGDRVIAFRRTVEKAYVHIRLNNGETEIESRFILSETKGPTDPAEYHAHHKNENKHDNTPLNLEWKTKTRHHSDHMKKRREAGPTGWEVTGVHPRGMLGKSQTEKQKKSASLTHKGVPKSPETVAKMRKAWITRRNNQQGTNHIVERVEFYGYEDVYDMTVEGCHNFVANGVIVHNSGKTFTSIQYCLRAPKTVNIGMVAFNKHIATEAGGKLRASGLRNVSCYTYHSLGNRAVRTAFPKLELDEEKMMDLLMKLPRPEEVVDAQWGRILSLTRRMVSHCKSYLLLPSDRDFFERFEEIADHHDLDLNGVSQYVLDLIPQILKADIDSAKNVIDFDDMPWLPVILKLPPPTNFDVLISDESQDLNACQHELAFQMCPKGRLVFVGDEQQAIYGFRGANCNSMKDLEARLADTERGVTVLPLTLTRRCPKSHVRLAQAIYQNNAITPMIEALDTAPEGEVLSMTETKAIQEMKAGDMVLCRVNSKLIPVAYALIRRGIRPIIRGRKLGEGLLELIRKLSRKAKTIEDLCGELTAYNAKESLKLMALGDKGAGRLGALREKCDCLMELMQGIETIPDLLARINSIFGDFEEKPGNAVILGTVHRTKGLEAERIFILSPELLPHPMAKKPWEVIQENNLAIIASTRAKYDVKTGAPGTIIFCGGIPAVYSLMTGKKKSHLALLRSIMTEKEGEEQE